MEETLARYPLLARLLVELFEARFEPGTRRRIQGRDRAGHANASARSCRRCWPNDAAAHDRGAAGHRRARRTRERRSTPRARRSRVMLDRVASLDEDRILRSFMAVINATLRTSLLPVQGRQARTAAPATTSASSSIRRWCPTCRSRARTARSSCTRPRVEGVHLRFGPVARGGLRWSDRREDFRTEVLGLVKAQMVKNTVIVPVGSKGGFFVQAIAGSGGDRERGSPKASPATSASSTACSTSPTTCVDGKVVHPADVVRHDGDDPYLVVAADKGTATFSDIANGIARRARLLAGRRVRLRRLGRLRPQGHGHHRQGRVGIGQAPLPRAGPRLARRRTSPAWASATCPATCSATACCCRSTSACWPRSTTATSSSTRIPMRRASFAERERMFALPRSSWDDYDKTLISARAAACIPRSAKSIPISPEVRAALGIEADVDADDADRTDERDPEGAGRPAVERRHRHLRQGHARNPRRRRRPRQQRAARQRRASCAARWWARAATWA